MQIAVASGKGGTGKTLVSTCLLRVLGDKNSVLIDTDVEEPNAGLVLGQA
nr:ATPase [Atribacterota bacterium]